jgi:hypothetical protein
MSDRIGGIRVAQGRLLEALQSHSDALAIRDRLVRADPDNAGWQRDVAISHITLENGNRRDSQGARDFATGAVTELLCATPSRCIVGPVVSESGTFEKWRDVQLASAMRRITDIS